MKTDFWQTEITFRHHYYWHRKEQFQLETDQYEFWVIFAVEAGSFDYEIKQYGRASFGDLVLCPPGTPFWRKIIVPLSFHYLEFYIADDQGELAAMLPSKITLHDVQRLASTYHHLRRLEYRNDPLSQGWKAHLLYDLFNLYKMETNIQQPLEMPPNDHLIAQAVQHLQQKATESSLSLKNLAKQLELSPVQLTRRFRASFGMNPSDYLTSIRLQKARTLLLETNDTLDSIAVRCGYENGFYFSRVFTKKMHTSPSRFRKTYRV